MKRTLVTLSLILVFAMAGFAQTIQPKSPCCGSCCPDGCTTCCPDGCGDCCQGK